MTYKDRKNYLLYTSVAFLVGAALYGILSLLMVLSPATELSSFTKILYFAAGTLLGGYLIGSILSGIFMFSSFIKKQSKKFKIFAIIFFFITIQLIFFVGFFATLPYYIYNLIHVRQRRIIVEK